MWAWINKREKRGGRDRSIKNRKSDSFKEDGHTNKDTKVRRRKRRRKSHTHKTTMHLLLAVPEDAGQAMLVVVGVGSHHLQVFRAQLVPGFVESLRGPEEEVQEHPKRSEVEGGGREEGRKGEGKDG